MGKCNIDHSQTAVLEKLHNQKEFLPASLIKKAELFLEHEQTQADLNDLFHLLKKYDLASVEERKERDEKLLTMVN